MDRAVTLVVAFPRASRGAPGTSLDRLRRVRWPWFIAAFVATAAAFTWISELAPIARAVVMFGQRALVTALYLIGLSLSRESLAQVGVRPLVLGVLLWIVLGVASLGLAIWNA